MNANRARYGKTASLDMRYPEIRYCRCVKCGHEWIPKGESPNPRMCPRCHTRRWEGTAPESAGSDALWHNLPKISDFRKLSCGRCGHEWMSILDHDPLRCPKCLSKAWNRKYFDHVCRICGFEWESQTESPKRCPRCRRTTWCREGPLPRP